MSKIEAVPLPDHALLASYKIKEHYTDCFVAAVPGDITHAAFVEAFYTTPLFKLERLLLSWFAARPSSDSEAKELALAKRNEFAAWFVESRVSNQLLLSDFMKSTRSWLMTETAIHNGQTVTLLHFGSAVVTKKDPVDGKSRMSFAFRALLGFHKLYSRLLLAAATRRLR